MFKDIKSLYFIKLLFLYIDERQKLKIAKYNKSLQKSINISIMNYKFFTRKYLIYESNGIGKEYSGYDDILIYEGEYLNGRRYGKGKEYDSFGGELIYEGEYLNGRRNGKEKEYYYNGKLEFEGEYLNGQKNGKGKKYYYNGKLEFEGEYLDDKEWIGIRYDEKGNIIYKLDKGIIGKMKEYGKNNLLLFDGEYLNGEKTEKEKNIMMMVN